MNITQSVNEGRTFSLKGLLEQEDLLGPALIFEGTYQNYDAIVSSLGDQIPPYVALGESMGGVEGYWIGFFDNIEDLQDGLKNVFTLTPGVLIGVYDLDRQVAVSWSVTVST